MSVKRNMFITLSSLSFGLAITLAASSAGAERSESGTSCIKIGSSGVLGVWNQGVIGNLDYTDTMTVYCPITRELGENTPGNPLVHVNDRNTGDGVECSFYDVRAYGQSWDWSGWESTLGSGPSNYQTISWPAQGNSEDKFAGFHHFLCHIPPQQVQYGATVLASYSSGE